MSTTRKKGFPVFTLSLALLGAAAPAGAGESGAVIRGDLDFPSEWTVFAPFNREDPPPSRALLESLPGEITVGGETVAGVTVSAVNGQYDFRAFPGYPAETRERTSYVFVPLRVESGRTVTLGMGADWLLQVWVNGEEVFNNAQDEEGNPVVRPQPGPPFPPAIRDFTVEVTLREGLNVLVARHIAGNSSATLALGGPRELRAGNFNSILADPLLRARALPRHLHSGAGRWTAPGLRAAPGEKPAVEIGTRLELFVDEFLVDSLAGGARRRLHQPTRREAVMKFGDEGEPWDRGRCVFNSLVVDDGRIRIYYSGQTETGRETTAVIESEDGLNFTRPELGLREFRGSKANNIIFDSGTVTHNFVPFLDENPAASADERYKAFGRGPGGMRFYASPDGYDWRLMEHDPGITPGPTDTQNLAFWDPLREHYVAYLRAFRPHRCIRVATSPDLVNWTETELLEYADDRLEDLYTNVIRPYFRAPHLYLGFPNRFNISRKRVPEHPHRGINDVVLMSSRDGKLFERWDEGFIRANTDWQNWTDRNLHVAWGMVETAPGEISLYVTEHYRHPTLHLRRWTIRTDGFASLHAGGEVGEMLTRPLIFDGNRLVVNYATSAFGTLRFELCDAGGNPIEGFELAESELLYGNEIEQVVRWAGREDLSGLRGRPVRLRVRLQDADLYSIRFAVGE